MGLTTIAASIMNPQRPEKTIEETFLVDSGAIYSVVPGEKLEKLGIKPTRKMNFILADGTRTQREIGDALYEFEGIRAAAPVIFGKRGDNALLGSVTLEALGLILDPFKRKLRPLKLLMV